MFLVHQYMKACLRKEGTVSTSAQPSWVESQALNILLYWMCDISGHLLKMLVYRELILGASVELVFLDCHGLAKKNVHRKN